MNRKYIIIFFLLLVQLNNLTAKKINFGMETGYGTYDMTQTKHILETTMNSTVLQPKCIHNFPGYLYFRPYVGFDYQYFNIGIGYTLMSTGARYSIHDYSGEYKFDAQIVGSAASLFLEIPVYTIHRFKFLIASEGGIIYNKMKLDEFFQLNDIVQQQDGYNLTSDNFFIKPYLKTEYKIWKSISSTISIGYHKDLSAKNMHIKGDNSRTTEFIADWDGLRASIGICFSFD